MKTSSQHFFLFFLLLNYFTLFILSLDSSSDIVGPNDSHISDLLVTHYDCSKQHNLRHFSLTRVQPCAQAPSAFESTRAIANVFVRAKAKRLKAWTCEVYVKREKFVCAHSDYKYSRHDCTEYHENTMERPRTLDSTEFKHAIRYLNGTDSINFSLLMKVTPSLASMIFKNNASFKQNNHLFVLLNLTLFIFTPFTIVWFPEELCLIFSIHSFFGRMSNFNNRYWL